MGSHLLLFHNVKIIADIAIFLFRLTIYTSLIILLFFLLRLICREKLGARARMIIWRIILCSFVLFAGFSFNDSWKGKAVEWISSESGLHLFPPDYSPLLIDVFLQTAPNETSVGPYTGKIFGHVLTNGTLKNIWSGEITGLIYGFLTVWLIGLICFWAYYICNYCLQRRAIRHFPLCSDEAILSLVNIERIAAGISEPIPCYTVPQNNSLFQNGPCVFGFRSPKLIIPITQWECLNDSEREVVITHECLHIRKKDTVRNLCLLVFQSVLWFNPIIWYAFKAYRNDLECLRDRQIMEMYKSDEIRKVYSKAMLSIVKTSYGKYHCSLHSGMLNSSGLGLRVRLIAASRSYILLDTLFVMLFIYLGLWILSYGLFYMISQALVSF